MKKIFLFLFLIFFVYFIAASSHGLIDPDEPRYATTAMNMVKSGNYIVPYFNGDLRINKPPLTYWLIAISYKFFGINELTSRLPHIILSIFLVILGLLFSKDFFKNLIVSKRFILILTTSPFFFYLGIYCNTDIIVSFFFTTTLFFFYKFFKTEKSLYLALFFLSYFLTNIAKGPVAYIAILIILIFLIFEKGSYKFKNYKFWIITFFISLTPVFYLFIVSIFTNGIDIITLISTETTGRFLKGYRHPEPVYFYFKFFPILFFPWSIFFIFKIHKIKELWHENDFNRLNIIWFIAVLLFFSFSKSKLLSYILPLSFPFAYLTAQMLSFYSFSLSIQFKWIVGIIGVIILILTGFVIYENYLFPDIMLIACYLFIILFILVVVHFESDIFIKLGFINLILLLSIFIIGSDVINQNKSEKFLEKFKSIVKNEQIVTFRRDITGTAFYLGEYKKIDNAVDLEKLQNVYVVSYKNVLLNKLRNLKKIAETKKKIFFYKGYNENRDK